MSNPSGLTAPDPGWDGSDPDSVWRRPADGEPERPVVAPATPAPTYVGPPPMLRPREAVGSGALITPPPAPRRLPDQDHDALDLDEAQARQVTMGVGVLTLVVLFLLLLMLVIRAGSTTL